MQLIECRDKSLNGDVCRDKSREKRNFLWRGCCWEKRRLKRLKRAAGDGSITVMRPMKGRGESVFVDAGRCFTAISGTTLARLNKGTSSCRGMQQPDWVARSGWMGLLVIREKSFFLDTHEEEREEEL